MNYPKVISAKAVDDHTLLIVFENHQKKYYDITPLFKRDMFSLLKNPVFLKQSK